MGHARTSVELQTLLNHQATRNRAADEGWEPGEKQSLERLKLAIKYKQKKVRGMDGNENFQNIFLLKCKRKSLIFTIVLFTLQNM